MELRISITSDTATPQQAKLMEEFRRTSGLNAAMGRRVVRDTSTHVREWGLSHPNKLGGRRTNYWSGIAAKINPTDTLEVSDANATMTLSGDDMPGITRAFGDVTITPGTKTPGAKYLAIPGAQRGLRTAPARNVRAGSVLEGQGKSRRPRGRRRGARKRDSKNGKKGSTRLVPGLVMYWFVDSVTQPQDRTLLPSEEEWSESATEGAKEYVDLAIAKSAGGQS